uniref:protein CHUP1, chloroplastic-like n=1 Tax=Erigeron canadensis TaxID=72917 RepID=UPI001CB8ACB9|nr:protein CHUP1, chloroplastic-like [Erigeron canadensis]
MVTGKIKGIQKSPINQSPSASNNNSNGNGKVPQKGAMFSRSFGVYFPRSSAQVQPKPPDVTELLHLVEQLRERESRLRTELLEQKLLKESVAILPVLENEISKKDSEISRSCKKIECLEAENERLRQEVEMLHLKLTEQRNEFEKRIQLLQASENSVSNRFQFQQLMDISGKSNMIKSLKRGHTFANVAKNMNQTTYDNNSMCYTESNSKESILVEIDNLPRLSRCDSLDNLVTDSVIRSRVPRVPKPPPRPSTSSSVSSSFSLSSSCSSNGSLSSSAERVMAEQQQPPAPPPPPPSQTATAIKMGPPPPPPPPRLTAAPPPPPPPPAKGLKPFPAKVRRVPEVVEFYHSLMRRESRRECGGSTAADVLSSTANTRDMIGEIENRSTHLLAIKTDVETQGDFIRFLIKEVENASFTDIEDVVPFVKWLDDELSYLVDERAVLKHFEWPEHKADALREAAFGYSDLKKLESEVSSFCDDPRQPCAPALKKMQGLFEKLEHGVYNLSRMRESASTRYKVFQIPMDWMQEAGFVAQIKLASVKLAMKYMRRVSAELETVGGPEEEELIVQGVRFAFRVHQFAGGFDVETMRAFQELRDKVKTCHEQCQSQQQQKSLCRSTAC